MNLLKKLIKKNNKGEYLLSLDVGTKNVKSMISYVDYETGMITNLGVGKVEQESKNMIGGKISNPAGITFCCQKSIEKAEKAANVHTEKAVIGFSGNIVKICTHSFTVSRENSRNKIDNFELKSIIQDVYNKALEEIQRGLTYKEKQAGIELVSADIVDFGIDGYRVINPLNFKGNKIKIGISSSYILASDFDIIEKMGKDLGIKINKIAYGPYSVVKAIGASDALNFSAVLVDVGGNITDVVLVKNGNIQRAGMFILGGNLFTKRISNKFDISEENAEDLKMKYSAGSIREEEQKRIDQLLSEDINLWLSGVELLLEESSEKYLVPSNILCYGGGSQLPKLINSLNELAKTNIPFSGKIKLNFIQSKEIVGNIDKTEKLNDIQDITLVGLAHLCLDTIDNEDTPNKVLGEIILKK